MAPPRRPALHQADGKARRRLDGGQPAARQHQEEGCGDPHLAQPRLQPAEVARHQRLHIGVGDGGAEALPLAHLGADLRGERDGHGRQFGAQDLGRALLMRGVHEAVQEADGQRLDALGLQEGDVRAQARLIERAQHLAGVVQALRHRQAPAARHQGLRQLDVEVVLVVAALIAQREHVAEALGGEQRGLRPLALDQRVGGEGRAVDDQRDVGGRQCGAGQRHAHAFQHAQFRGMRRGQHLGGPAGRLARRVLRLQGDVGEGAANVGRKTNGTLARPIHALAGARSIGRGAHHPRTIPPSTRSTQPVM